MSEKSTQRKSDDLSISTVQDFKSRSKRIATLELPSGAVIQAKNSGSMSVFMKAGVIPNSLMAIVQESMASGQQPDMSSVLKDGNLDLDMVRDMLDVINTVTVECWVMPPVLPIPENEQDRDPELLYVDEVLDDDKVFVFQWVTGGTRDLEQFRQEHQAAMDNLERLSDVGSPA